MKEKGPVEGGEQGNTDLARIAEEYMAYKDFLPGLSDSAFDYQKHLQRDADIGGFLADFAIEAEERRRNIVRWSTGGKLPEADSEKLQTIKSALPEFVVPNREAVNGMRVERANRFRIDIVTEEIINEATKRLPRTLDAYRYHQDYSEDQIEIPGLGKIKLILDQGGDGIFTSVFTIEGDTFRIHNSRQSGVKYLDRLNDLSRPGDIEIKPKKILIELYDDDSGNFVTIDGKKYTNARIHTRQGSGYADDFTRDQLLRCSNFRVDNESDWRSDLTELSWKKVEDEAIVWLVDNVLNPIKASPLSQKQIDVIPMEEPFPEGKVGPLFAFVKVDELEKVEILKHGIERAYPDERTAVKPNWRLIPYSMNRGDLPEIVHDGFIWCGIGMVGGKTDMKKLFIADRQMDTWSVFSQEGLAEIKPLTASDVYVVDWDAWDSYRERTFTPDHDRLNNEEVGEMYREVGKTLVPIIGYKGNYKKPIVLISRNLEVNEIGNVYFPPKEIRR